MHTTIRRSFRFKHFCLSISAVVLALLCIAPNKGLVFAQSIQSSARLSVAPATAYIKVQPGTTVTHSIMVRNPTDFAATVTVDVMDFVADGTSGLPQVQKKLTFPYLEKDKSLEQPRSIPPKSQITIPISIKVPAGANEQEYPLTVLISSQTGSTDGATALIPTIGSNMIVWITEREKPVQKLKVVSLQRPVIVDSFRPLEFKPLVANLEIMSAVASGSASVIDWRGQVLGTMQIFPEVILGQSTRIIQGASPEESLGAPSATDTTASNIRPAEFSFTQPFWLGPYTIEFTFIAPTDSGDVLTVQQLHIIALPISLFIVGGVSAIVLLLGWWWKKSRKFRILEMMI